MFICWANVHLGVDVAVEDDPLPLVDLAAHVVHDPPQDVREETVPPLQWLELVVRVSRDSTLCN